MMMVVVAVLMRCRYEKMIETMDRLDPEKKYI